MSQGLIIYLTCIPLGFVGIFAFHFFGPYIISGSINFAKAEFKDLFCPFTILHLIVILGISFIPFVNMTVVILSFVFGIFAIGRLLYQKITIYKFFKIVLFRCVK